MIDPEAQRLFEFILSADVTAQDCASIQEAIHRYVDLGIAGHRMDVLMPGVALHLAECGACRDVYEALDDLARMETQGTLPSVAELWPGLVGGAAATAIAQATSPANVVPMPRRAPAPRPAVGPARSGLRQRMGAGWRPHTWLPALAGVALLVVAIGWWLAAERGPRVDEGLISTLSGAEQVRSARMPSGAWAKVFFGPNSRTALVFVGGLPEPQPEHMQIECWLQGADGSRRLAGVFRRRSSDESWWTVNVGQSLQAYTAMALTWADDEAPRPLVEIPLVASR